MNIKSKLLGAVTFFALTAGAHAEILTLVNADALGSPMDMMNKHFAEILEEKSNGDIEVNYISGNQLGTPPQVMDQMSTGSVDALGTAGSWLSAYAPDTNILTWGFTFRDGQHVIDFFDSDLFGDLVTDMQETGRIRVLAAGPTEPRIAFLTKPLSEDGSFEGRKMRIPQISAYLDLWTALGAQPTQVAWSEVYLAMSTGVVDGAEGPPTAAIAQRFHEVAPNIYLTNHVWATSTIMINEDKFNKMSPKHQAMVEEAAQEAVDWAYEDATTRREEVLMEMTNGGATVKEYDATGLAEIARDAVAEAEEKGLWRKGLYKEVQTVQ